MENLPVWYGYYRWLPKLGVCSRLCNPSYWDVGILEWLVDREPPEGSRWPSEGLHYTWGSTRGSAHNQIPPEAG